MVTFLDMEGIKKYPRPASNHIKIDILEPFPIENTLKKSLLSAYSTISKEKI